MAEHPEAVTFKGNPITLKGDAPEVGASAPNAALTAGDMSEVSIGNWEGKVRILNVVPSLDTPVCDVQTRTFNQRASELGDDAVVVTVSRDLPFAQNRWCGSAGIERVAVLSDYKDRAFGDAYGLGMKELGLLARSVFVIDRDGVVRYREIVAEQTDEPDYDAALSAAKAALER
ncbi:MAG: thiol peroxidase [Myxococcota bacterium]